MNDRTHETLSALIDGELSSEEIALAVERLVKSEDLGQKWSHYHVISDVMHGEQVRSEYRDIIDRVRQRLGAEPAILAPVVRSARRPTPHWVKPVAGSALAASVAVLAVLVGPRFIDRPPGAAPVLVAKPVGLNQLYADDSGTHWNLDKPAVESRLNSYLINHQEYAPLGSMRAMLPYVTVVSYDAGR